MHKFSFHSIRGNAAIKKALIETSKTGKIPHAQLFHGPEGSPNLLLAMAYAKYLICKNPLADDSCGACKNCRQFDSHNYPDFHMVFPYPSLGNEVPIEKVSGAHNDYEKDLKQQIFNNPFYNRQQWSIDQNFENKRFIIHTAEALLLIKKLGLQSYSGGKKLVLIWLPETMNDSAANKLLKLIEEPPASVVLLFVSYDLSQIISTIKSRIQITNVNKFNEEDTIAYVSRLLSISEEASRQLTIAHDNDISKIIETRKDNRNETVINLFADWMRHCFKMDGKGINSFVDEVSLLKKSDLTHFFAVALEIIERAYTYNMMPDRSTHYIPEGIAFRLDRFANHIHTGNIEKINTIVTEGLQDIERNGNKKVILMDISLKLGNALRIKGT